jgi:DsbC/DsbD-like thiol-disulfide interchange protein
MVAAVKRWTLVSCSLLCACGPSGPGPEPAGPPATRTAEVAPAEAAPRIDVGLVADVTRVASGQEFVVAASFDIEPGWHIYWLNPGETGLPTRMVVSVPEGFEVGPLRYPGPVRFDSPGPVTSYGYEGATALSARVFAPDQVTGPVEIAAEVSWLACKDACVQGSARPTLVLEPATATEPSGPAHAELFEDHRRALPVPWSEIEGAGHSVTTRGTQQELVLTVPGAASLEFFPGPETELAMVGQASAPAEGETALRLLLRSGDTPERLTGVVGIQLEGERAPRYGEVDLPWPPSADDTR